MTANVGPTDVESDSVQVICPAKCTTNAPAQNIAPMGLSIGRWQDRLEGS